MRVDEMLTEEPRDLGTTDWITVSQEQVNGFADVTGDHQWIHLDRERAAAETPFGTTIAHGYLLLSLVPVIVDELVTVEDRAMGVNYGVERLRFTGPVATDSRVRGRLRLLRGERRPDGAVLTTYELVLERENQERPALVAELLSLHYAESTVGEPA